MRHPRTCSTPEGGSRFEDVEVELAPVAFVPGNPPLDLSTPRTATVAHVNEHSKRGHFEH
jgi:hypothetical protein